MVRCLGTCSHTHIVSVLKIVTELTKFNHRMTSSTCSTMEKILQQYQLKTYMSTQYNNDAIQKVELSCDYQHIACHKCTSNSLSYVAREYIHVYALYVRESGYARLLQCRKYTSIVYISPLVSCDL